jgi:hypothetical protein
MQAEHEVEAVATQVPDNAELRCAKLVKELEDLKRANQQYLAIGLAWKKRFEATQALLVKTMEENANELKTLHDLMAVRGFRIAQQ